MNTAENKTELGEIVPKNLAMEMAKTNCKWCFGTAVITVCKGEARTPQLCGCAKKRFLRKYPLGKAVAFDPKGELRYLIKEVANGDPV